VNYIHIQLTLEKDTPVGGFIPNALKGKVHVDETDEDEDEFGLGVPVRVLTLSGEIDSETLAEFRDEWIIEPENAEPALGFLGDLGDGVPRLYADERHMPEPMDWNMGGVTPVIDATVSIIGDDAQPAGMD
jgi:hypothetical protein